MSITVRLFSDEELKTISKGKNNFLATVLANKKTYTPTEMKSFSKIRKSVREFLVSFDYENDEPFIKIYAFDIESLKWFISQEYHIDHLESVTEVITRYVIVSFEDWEN